MGPSPAANQPDGRPLEDKLLYLDLPSDPPALLLNLTSLRHTGPHPPVEPIAIRSALGPADLCSKLRRKRRSLTHLKRLVEIQQP